MLRSLPANNTRACAVQIRHSSRPPAPLCSPCPLLSSCFVSRPSSSPPCQEAGSRPWGEARATGKCLLKMLLDFFLVALYVQMDGLGADFSSWGKSKQ